MKNTYVHVEVLDHAMRAEYIVAVPVFILRQSPRPARIMYDGTYYTCMPIHGVLSIPGSFIVRQRRFENERIS